MNKKFASGGKRPMLGKGRFGRTKPRSRGLSSGCSPGPTRTGDRGLLYRRLLRLRLGAVF